MTSSLNRSAQAGMGSGVEGRVPLTELDHRLLCALTDTGGLLTKDVRSRARLPASREQSRVASQALHHMEKLGLVTRLDAEKPIAWVRTRAGSARAKDPTWIGPPTPEQTGGE